MKIKFSVNAKKIETECSANETLARLLRRLGYKEVKLGCEEGDCGACCVLFNGRTVNSCMIFAPAADGCEVITVAGIGTIHNPHPLQKAYVEEGAVQCGYCAPGSIVSAKDLIDRQPNPTEEEIKIALSGNLCRCTGYYKQIKAIQKAAKLKNSVEF